MKTVYKKAISLANKNGQNFIKEMAAYYTYIGIEEGNISNWFVLIAKSKETEGVRKGCPHFFCKSPNFRKLGLFY